MTQPESPKSPTQKYRLIEKGKTFTLFAHFITVNCAKILRKILINDSIIENNSLVFQETLNIV